MRTHVLALAASAAALTIAPLPALAQSGSPLGSLFACNNPGANNRTGAVVGGLAGALLGSQVSKNERTLGAIVGAGLGAAAGNYVGCRMNTTSRASAETAFEQALNTGRAQTWRDSRTGAAGRIEVVSGGYDAPYAGGAARPVAANELQYGRGIDRAYSLTSAAPMYVARSNVNVRAAPTTRAPIVDRLVRGQQITVAGMVDGGWLAVEDGGRVEGYVAASTVRPAGGMTYARNASYDTNCRVVQQTVTQRGYDSETTRYNACRDGAGQWRLNPI